MGILEGKRVLVTGLTAHNSIAFGIADQAQREGAKIVVSNFGRAMRMTRRSVAKLDPVPDIIELDVTNEADLARLPDELMDKLGGVDGVVHSIAFADPVKTMGGRFLSAPWEAVAQSLQISSYSLAALARACAPIMEPGGAFVALSFQANVSWPSYDWMGVSKASLEAVSRYLARYLGPMGIRSNIVSAGPINTLSKKAIPIISDEEEQWVARAPLRWDPNSTRAAALAACALLSDYFGSTTGEIVHVDGGFHSTGIKPVRSNLIKA
ncbi:MAG: enoyl-ACP reductase FabI [Propionibacteriaceae bacterium]|jgi:enoyl-[acyl-carrier protein] reductase I|nr:enoyl-ACP reductase FabI [Propionibacteriaceae bacterium]